MKVEHERNPLPEEILQHAMRDAAPRMDLRDYFAAQAMLGFLVSSPAARDDDDKCAEWSYRQADAMLAEREKK